MSQTQLGDGWTKADVNREIAYHSEIALALMDTTADGVVACVADAGATFLAPIFDELTAVVCLSGTPQSHIGIVSREYQVPCVMATEFANGVPDDGTEVEVDCSADPGTVRAV